jgi:hypothetical protein
MSIQAMAWVLDFSEARLADRLVLLSIANHMNSEGTAWPSIPRIAREARLTERQVYRSIRNLKNLGELAVIGGGLGRSNRYRLPGSRQNGTPEHLSGDRLTSRPRTPDQVSGDPSPNRKENPSSSSDSRNRPKPETTTQTPDLLLKRLLEWRPPGQDHGFDRAAIEELWTKCRQNKPSCSPEEVIKACDQKFFQNLKRSNGREVRNWPGFLLTVVPRCLQT